MVEFQEDKLIFIAIIVAATIVIVLSFFLLALYKYYHRKTQQQLELQIALLHNQEIERIRIAKELHDGIGIIISSIAMQTNNINDSDTHAEAIESAKKVFVLVDRASKELRQIVYNLSPYNLEKHGLLHELHELKYFASKQNLNISIDCMAPIDGLSLTSQILIYRIVQELLNNTLKYAEAQNITLNFEVEQHQLIMQYADDGKGLNTNVRNGYGLKTIEFRTRLLNGTHKMMNTNKGLAFEFLFNLKKLS